jgi:hypothetical protein
MTCRAAFGNISGWLPLHRAGIPAFGYGPPLDLCYHASYCKKCFATVPRSNDGCTSNLCKLTCPATSTYINVYGMWLPNRLVTSLPARTQQCGEHVAAGRLALLGLCQRAEFQISAGADRRHYCGYACHQFSVKFDHLVYACLALVKNCEETEFDRRTI